MSHRVNRDLPLLWRPKLSSRRLLRDVWSPPWCQRGTRGTAGHARHGAHLFGSTTCRQPCRGAQAADFTASSQRCRSADLSKLRQRSRGAFALLFGVRLPPASVACTASARRPTAGIRPAALRTTACASTRGRISRATSCSGAHAARGHALGLWRCAPRRARPAASKPKPTAPIPTRGRAFERDTVLTGACACPCPCPCVWATYRAGATTGPSSRSLAAAHRSGDPNRACAAPQFDLAFDPDARACRTACAGNVEWRRRWRPTSSVRRRAPRLRASPARARATPVGSSPRRRGPPARACSHPPSQRATFACSSPRARGDARLSAMPGHLRRPSAVL
jgi:hypothetical protein